MRPAVRQLCGRGDHLRRWLATRRPRPLRQVPRTAVLRRPAGGHGGGARPVRATAEYSAPYLLRLGELPELVAVLRHPSSADDVQPPPTSRGREAVRVERGRCQRARPAERADSEETARWPFRAPLRDMFCIGKPPPSPESKSTDPYAL